MSRKGLACALLLIVLLGYSLSLAERYVTSDYDGESGEEGTFDGAFNFTRLEVLVREAVDQRLSDLRSLLLANQRNNNNNQKAKALHHKHGQTKEKIKSLEFRMLRLSKDLELTKSAMSKQTESLDHTVKLSETYLETVDNLNQRQNQLENVVSNLAHKVEKLANALKSDSLHTNRKSASENQISGSSQDQRHQDCSSVYRDVGSVFRDDFFITIQPDGATRPFTVFCKVLNNTAWTVIQKRMNGSVDFYRTWADYRDGFGDAKSEFWIGNENIHHLTKNGQMSLRIVMQDWENVVYYAQYDHFKIANEDDMFRLHARGYRGNAGDSLTSAWESHDGQPFSTHDRDNDARFYDNCAEHFHGAWWFKSCFISHLNGNYYSKENHKNYFNRNGIQWNTLHMYASLKSTMMMIAPRTSEGVP